MDKEEYEEKKKTIETEEETTTTTKAKTYDRRGQEVPDKVLEMIEESDRMITQQRDLDEEKQTTTTEQEPTTMNRLEIEELPDLAEFMQTEEFLRMGTDARIPYNVTLGGKQYKVYIRPLGSNEFYKLQLKQLRDKVDLNYLAVQKACTDTNGKPLPTRLLDKLGYDIINNIGEAIRIASGETDQNNNTEELLENLLKE